MNKPIYNDKILKIYGSDPREIPRYGLSETARYLKLHVNTLRSWIYGRPYFVGENKQIKKSLPVIKLHNPEKPLLSFMNLVEVHVLSAITKIHKVQFKKVRLALEYLESRFPTKYPLANNQFWTDEFELYVEHHSQVICASRDGQMVLKEVIEQYLHRIDRDVDLKPFRVYPFSQQLAFTSLKESKNILENAPKNIAIDPLVAFGNPTIAGTGIATNVIFGRFNAGEKIETLAEDYEIEKEKIQEAIEYEGFSLKVA